MYKETISCRSSGGAAGSVRLLLTKKPLRSFKCPSARLRDVSFERILQLQYNLNLSFRFCALYFDVLYLKKQYGIFCLECIGSYDMNQNILNFNTLQKPGTGILKTNRNIILNASKTETNTPLYTLKRALHKNKYTVMNKVASLMRNSRTKTIIKKL